MDAPQNDVQATGPIAGLIAACAHNPVLTILAVKQLRRR